MANRPSALTTRGARSPLLILAGGRGSKLARELPGSSSKYIHAALSGNQTRQHSPHLHRRKKRSNAPTFRVIRAPPKITASIGARSGHLQHHRHFAERTGRRFLLRRCLRDRFGRFRFDPLSCPITLGPLLDFLCVERLRRRAANRLNGCGCLGLPGFPIPATTVWKCCQCISHPQPKRFQETEDFMKRETVSRHVSGLIGGVGAQCSRTARRVGRGNYRFSPISSALASI